MGSHAFKIVLDVVALAIAAGAVGWFLFSCLKRSEDPARLVFKWVLTALVVLLLVKVVGPSAAQGGYGVLLFLPLTAICAIALIIIWRHNIGGLISKPFTNLYDGGTEPPIPQPVYSTARALQKRGNYLEAVAEIYRQLERFPTDLEGQLLLAEIQAESFKDPSAAELTIEGLCAQPGHAAQNIAFALYSLADWHLKIAQDGEAARRNLQKIVERFPESEFAAGAAHRIAHMSNTEMLLAPHERKKFVVTEGPRNLGLQRGREPVKPVEPDPAQEAVECVKHLEQHPLDQETRERLAVLYADHYGRLDMATTELEQMIAQPNQPGRLVAHWLNLLADLQVRGGAAFETVQQTLQRIVDRDPKAAPAEVARNRLALLRLELKAKDQNQAVKLGSYEQNIGLKRGLPRR
jgi:tetratricopeptide (TPR) repeat protein